MASAGGTTFPTQLLKLGTCFLLLNPISQQPMEVPSLQQLFIFSLPIMYDSPGNLHSYLPPPSPLPHGIQTMSILDSSVP